MPRHDINCPTALLTLLDQHAGYSRPAVLLAALRAVCEAPPPAPVAYPTLRVAERVVCLFRVPEELHAAARVVERRCFYNRVAWAVYYALAHYADRIEVLLHLDAEALARLDAASYNALSEASACPVPLTTRAPRAPKKPRPRA